MGATPSQTLNDYFTTRNFGRLVWLLLSLSFSVFSFLFFSLSYAGVEGKGRLPCIDCAFRFDFTPNTATQYVKCAYTYVRCLKIYTNANKYVRHGARTANLVFHRKTSKKNLQRARKSDQKKEKKVDKTVISLEAVDEFVIIKEKQKDGKLLQLCDVNWLPRCSSTDRQLLIVLPRVIIADLYAQHSATSNDSSQAYLFSRSLVRSRKRNYLRGKKSRRIIRHTVQ